jgi:hypothetical protein
MYPLASSSLAARATEALLEVARTIDHVQRASDKTERTGNALESLSRGLAGVLAELAEALQTPTLNPAKNAALWPAVHQAIDACKTTIDELEAEIEPLNEPSAVVAGLAGRIFQKRLEQPDLVRIVSHMKVHSINLQLSLQMVSW